MPVHQVLVPMVRAPVVQTTRRMLRHNALEAWAHMQKTGWVRCRPPVR